MYDMTYYTQSLMLLNIMMLQSLSMSLAYGGERFGSLLPAMFVVLAFPLVGACNVGGCLCRCDPLTQTLLLSMC